MSSPAIPKGSIVLVTGVTGFIGSHVANQLLKAGYRVRGTARDATKSEWISEFFHKTYGKDSFEVAVVPDFAPKGAFDEAVKGCSGVAHVASDLSFGPDPNQVVTPVLSATEHILESAAKEPSVKRFVYTSSSSATSYQRAGVKEHIDSSTWNTQAIEDAWKPPPYEQERGLATYCASKAQAEQAVWKFVKEKKPGFVANAVLPNYTIGKVLHPEQRGSTAGILTGLVAGDAQSHGMFGMICPQWAINVEDVALLHVAGLILSEVQNERLFAFAEPFNFNQMIEALKKAQSNHEHLPALINDPPTLLNTVDRVRTKEVLKLMGQNDFVNLEESLKQVFATA